MSKARARRMRKAPTDAERRLWHALRDRRFIGYEFRRQVPVGIYIADFVSFQARLIIEVDGSQHAESRRDAARDAWLRSQVFRILRFWNPDVLRDFDGVLATLEGVLSEGAFK